MGIFSGCLLACDVDGTLLINENLPEVNIEKIKYFVSEGGAFALSTGRTAGALSFVTDKIDCLSPSIVANGSVIYDFKQDRSVYELFIPETDRFIVNEVKKKVSTVGIELHSGKNVLVLNENKETLDHEKYENLTAKAIDYEESLRYNWNKAIYLFSDEREAVAVKEIIAQYETNSDFVDTSAVIDGTRRYYFEHVPRGVSKASAMKILCEKLNIKQGCCFAIGDYYNDLAMIKAADIGAALENSPDEVKRAADVTVCNVEDGAVADFINYLTNIRKEI